VPTASPSPKPYVPTASPSPKPAVATASPSPKPYMATAPPKPTKAPVYTTRPTYYAAPTKAPPSKYE